jgi:acetyltransferase-like isoleucine patch superfamily enzyme
MATKPNFRMTAKHHNVFGASDPELIVEQNVHIKDTVTIDLSANIHICQHSEIQDYVQIFTHKHHWRNSMGLRKDTEIVEAVPLRIGRDVFIGVNAIIIGVRDIGNGAVIGAGSVLTHDVPAYEIWAGNPAVKIGERRDAQDTGS